MLRGCLPVLVLTAGCSAVPGDREVGLAASVLPNLGLTGELAQRVSGGPAGGLFASARFTQQFLDDEDFADDGFPGAGDHTQVDLGLVGRRPFDRRTAWHWRLAAVGFRARGRPNIVEEAGDYAGVLWALGFRTRTGSRWTFGPEVAVLAVARGGSWFFVPQLTWGFTYAPWGFRD